MWKSGARAGGFSRSTNTRRPTIYQKGETHINTHSVKADYDIKISFKGYDSALADIVSKSDITLNGVINNRSGTTNITTEGAIKVGSDYARILGDGLNLTATTAPGRNGTALAVDVAPAAT